MFSLQLTDISTMAFAAFAFVMARRLIKGLKAELAFAAISFH
jgi:hypothetical protein